MGLQSTQDILMVLSGSFLLGGWGDGEGGRAALARRGVFCLRCAGVYASSFTFPACPSWTVVLGAGSSHPGSGQWEHSAAVPGFTTGWAGDMFLHPTTHLSAQRALSLPPLAPSSMALPDLWPQGLSSLSLSQCFRSFPPSLSKISFSPAASSSRFSALPLNSCLASHGHISILVMSYFLLSQQKYLSNCSSNLPVASLPPSVFPALLLILQSHPFFHGLNEHSSYRQGYSGRVLCGCMPRDEGLTQIFVAMQRYLLILFSRQLQIFQSWTGSLGGKVTGIPIPCFQLHAGRANLRCQRTHENFLFAHV